MFKIDLNILRISSRNLKKKLTLLKKCMWCLAESHINNILGTKHKFLWDQPKQGQYTQPWDAQNKSMQQSCSWAALVGQEIPHILTNIKCQNMLYHTGLWGKIC
jgi:hypothetical protein